MMLEVKGLSCGYRRRTVVHAADLTVSAGEVVCLLGPNGSGKTTLFKTILGLLKPVAGEVLIEGRDALRVGRAERARAMAYVPQSHTPAFAFRVLDLVMMGRTAHVGIFASPSARDRGEAMAALEALEIAHLADRACNEISGGERQMVLIARALAQQARLLIMDEPTSNLDFGNQVRVLAQVRRLAARGLAIIMTTHYPSHALTGATRVALMHRGRLWRSGAPRETITEEALREMYGIEARVIEWTDDNGVRVGACIPLPV